MFNPTSLMIDRCIQRLQAGYRETYGTLRPDYVDLIGTVATLVLGAIAKSDAPYHNVEHTILVSSVGQEILRGKQLQTATVTCEAWLHFIVALLCHDIGYVQGVCQQDQRGDRCYATGVANHSVTIAPGATDASLTPYHVDRSKCFVAENFANHPLINVAVIQQHIEFTRFPVPADHLYQDTGNYPGLARAADLIGQLSDPRYLEKIPALFYEFEETGANQTLGYHHPDDLRAGYPQFFQAVVLPLIAPSLDYLQITPSGRCILATLNANLRQAKQAPALHALELVA